MTYITFLRFKGRGIDGDFNLPYGTRLEERDGWLFAPDGRRVCAVTSENGWNHFRPDTFEGARRQVLLDKLYRYYENGSHGDDFDAPVFDGQENRYWKSLLRNLPTAKLEAYCQEKIGGNANVQNHC